MSFDIYPIVPDGSNVDVIRQGHNIITAKVGNINGLQTQNKLSVVDAINSLQIAFTSLVSSAYPPLNNEQWLTANNAANTQTINLLKLSSSNEFVFGRTIIPFSAEVDLGKVGTGFRTIYTSTLHVSSINVFSPSTRLSFGSTTGFDFSTTNSLLSLTEISATQLELKTTADQLDIASTRTRLLSGAHSLELSTAGHIVPGANGTQNIGASDKKVNKIWAKELDVDGAVNLSGTVAFPANYGGQVPIGAGMLWFGPDNAVDPNWLILRGDVVSQATYPALFALYGTTFNTGGEGAGNFRLPDMRKRIPFGADATQLSNPDARSQGKLFGSLNHTHSVPAHYHNINSVNISSSGTHTHLVTDFSGPRNSSNSAITFNHSHGLNNHTHSISGNVSNSSPQPTMWITGNSDSPSEGGNDAFSVLGKFGIGNQHTVGEVIDTVPHNHSSVGLSVGTPTGTTVTTTETLTNGNDHRHFINSSGAHTHTVPSHSTVATGEPNGDVAMTSGTNNPPCFAMWFIVRAR